MSLRTVIGMEKMTMIPTWLQHLHGTPHGYWYYGCDCYRCYARQARDCGNEVMTEREWTDLNDEFDRVQAMPKVERDEYFRKESEEMMRLLSQRSPT